MYRKVYQKVALQFVFCLVVILQASCATVEAPVTYLYQSVNVPGDYLAVQVIEYANRVNLIFIHETEQTISQVGISLNGNPFSPLSPRNNGYKAITPQQLPPSLLQAALSGWASQLMTICPELFVVPAGALPVPPQRGTIDG